MIAVTSMLEELRKRSAPPVESGFNAEYFPPLLYVTDNITGEMEEKRKGKGKVRSSISSENGGNGSVGKDGGGGEGGGDNSVRSESDDGDITATPYNEENHPEYLSNQIPHPLSQEYSHKMDTITAIFTLLRLTIQTLVTTQPVL